MSTTSLLKSAANIRDQMANYQDEVQAYDYANSAYTDEALSTYSEYLQKRIDQMNATGTITGASKALSLTKSLQSATKSNISSSIQRENIQIMSGNATLRDKYALVAQQFTRAQSIGDLTLAQSLESQAYSISQSIQLQEQQAADAAVTLHNAEVAAGKSNAAAIGATVGNLQENLKQLNNDIKLGGNIDKTVKQWVKLNADALGALGVKVDSQAPNYFDLVSGIAGAEYNQYVLTAQAYAPYDAAKSQEYMTKAYNLHAGITKIPILGGSSLTADEITQASNGNGRFVFNPSSGKLVQTQQTGYEVTGKDGFHITPTYSGTISKVVVLSPSQTVQMTKLGLNFSANKNGTTGTGVQVQATKDSPAWIKNVLGDNGVTNMYSTNPNDPNSPIQFQFTSKSGTGLSTYTIVKDQKGLLGLAEESNTGSRILSGQYGFDGTSAAPLKASNGSFGDLLRGAFSNFGSMLGGASLSTQLNQATNHYTLPPPPPLPIAPPIQLPTLSVAAPVAQPRISVAPPPPRATTQSVYQHTASPQPASSGLHVQSGGSGISLQGGGGIRLQ